ncbi:hypothetical protein NLJ89_g4821 [Agrocybe chaxingu]|uniref:Major facilitator superfamily (MFS) profile domain-containing protein n=1 Tax=Agrocybe chaxingu TaxID=84603 RepID=A0A9W8K3D4_9AGAR|nr:hypothetical protein NLJ89_g4821 [Agrocybe chaxingu]
MGGLILVLWAIRFFGFPVYESPKYLLGRGRGKEAVEVVHKVAKFNGKTLKLTAEDLRVLEYGGMKAGTTPARSTVMLIVIWGLMGLASILYLSFVPYYLSTRGVIFGDGSVYITYRNLVIIGVVCLPGPSLSAYMIECRLLGRRRTVAISAGLAGIFVLATITARSSTALLLWNCACSIAVHMVYPALQTMTPELFPTKNRATGIAIVTIAYCISGVMAPVIALYANLATPVPIYIAGAIYLVAAVIALLLPYESRGRASM